jgi:2-polyprenyl-6-methoxyphenol hydroxylase-like FAD-dependent oxidoreductase
MNTSCVRADIDVDVVVVGCGPAGAALALRLQRLGYEVLVASPQMPRFRSSHKIETLTATTQDQLQLLGLQSALEAARRAPVEFEICWGGDGFEARAPSDLFDRNAFLAGLRKAASDAHVRISDSKVETFRRIECD